jgi:hypothetical protein
MESQKIDGGITENQAQKNDNDRIFQGLEKNLQIHEGKVSIVIQSEGRYH